jgi:hypothetical protein
MSSSKKQQLAVCKAAVEALLDEINEANEERKTVKSQLEKRMENL